MIPELYQLEWNRKAQRGLYPASLRGILSEADHTRARQVIESWPEYSPTPLLELPTLASRLGIGRLLIKDEAPRFGLGAFKAIGGAYAVYRVVQQTLRSGADPAGLTVACASAGNHGRAVAWGARRFGVNCVVYLYEGISDARVRAIEQLGATVNRDAPDFDSAVRLAADDAERNGWQVVSDTAYDGYTAIPCDVMQGYTLIAQEAVEEMAEPPTHVILQAGVGGFAAAIAARLWQVYEAERPTLITAEPSGAACVLESIRRDEMVELAQVSSMCGGLACGVVSTVAWDVLRRAIDYAVSIPDAAIPSAMRQLGRPASGDPTVVAGESGAAGIAALNWLALDPEAREQIGLHPGSRVLAFVTEGATDPERYRTFTRAALA